MPVVKPVNSITDVMRPDEGNDSSLDTFIKDAIGKQPPLSFSRPNDNPVQWIQLLHALDQPGTKWIIIHKYWFLSEVKRNVSWCSRWFFGSRFAHGVVWHWINLLISLVFIFSDYPGWPLLTPLKVQMQKCSKCSREFCSSINYRRHLRVHHRLKRLDKVSFILLHGNACSFICPAALTYFWVFWD